MTPTLDTLPATETRLEITKIRDKFPDALLDVNEFRGDTRITIKREHIAEVCRLMRDDPDLQYNFFSECLGVDYLEYREDVTFGGYLPDGYRFEVVYNLYSLQYMKDGKQQGFNRRIFLKVPVPESDPNVPTITGIYVGADFCEREIYDMFGVRFPGHPDLRRILMSDDWVGHPQRKDYPLGGERVQFPGGKFGPSVGEVPIQHPGESFYGKTGDVQGETYKQVRVPTPDRGPGTQEPPARKPGE